MLKKSVGQELVERLGQALAQFNTMTKRFLRIHTVALFAFFSCCICTAIFLSRPVSWTEDVRLSDGSVILLKVRLHGVKKFGEIGGPGGISVGEQEITNLEPLNINSPWRGIYGPAIIFNRTSMEEWYIVSAAASCEQVRRLRPSNTLYVEYHYRNGEWVQVPMPKERFGEKANLIGTDSRHHGHFSEEQKRQYRLGKGPIGEYDQVESNWKDNC